MVDHGKTNHPFGIYKKIQVWSNKLHTSGPDRTPWCYY